MSTYLHCSVTHAPLDNRECVALIMDYRTKSFIGIPIFATYNEAKGRFIFEKDDKQLVISLSLCQTHLLKKTYLSKRHSRLFQDDFKNSEFYLFPMLKSVYTSLLSSNIDKSIENSRESIENELISQAETEDLTFEMFQMFNEKSDEKNAVNPLLSRFENSEYTSTIKQFHKEQSLKNAIAFFDTRKRLFGTPLSLSGVVFPLNYVSLNTIAAVEDVSISEAVEWYLNILQINSIIKTIDPIRSEQRNYSHQGSYIDNYIEYHERIIEALKQEKED